MNFKKKVMRVALAAMLSITASVYAQSTGCSPAVSATAPMAQAVTQIKVENNSGAEHFNQPFTLGQVLRQGDVQAGEKLAAKLPDNTFIPLQNDVKAHYDDGSVKHVILTGTIPHIGCGETQTISLGKYGVPDTVGTSRVAAYTDSLQPTVKVTVNGVVYTANPAAKVRAGDYKTWLSGGLVNEAIVMVPLVDVNGVPHPHLNVRFGMRAYNNTDSARVEVVVENNWAYEPDPSNFTYDVDVNIAGQSVYSKLGMTHYHHARWRKVFNFGESEIVNIKHDARYMIASKLAPNYDQSVLISQANIDTWKTAFNSANKEPMGNGLLKAYMPTTGGRPDIGLLPAWTATYILSQDNDMKKMVLNTGDMSASWSMHYRDKNTDKPLKISDYPYATWGGNQYNGINPITKKSERLVTCVTSCDANPNTYDSSHHPSMNFIPYAITGDYFYLEEQQFWTVANNLQFIPEYRNFADGLVRPDQLRGQGWAIRTLAESAFISPDDDPIKPEFTRILAKNFEWYKANFVDNNANNLGMITYGYAMSYNNGTGLAPWQDDFFTQSVGRAYELGNASALPLLKWKAKSPVGRMLDTGFCWIEGAGYTMNVRDSSTSPWYTTFEQVYKATFPAAETSLACGSTEMATYLKLKVGEMTGYSDYNAGYPSDMQPALSYAVDSGANGAASAWSKFMARTVKPNYATGPQFAIIPR